METGARTPRSPSPPTRGSLQNLFRDSLWQLMGTVLSSLILVGMTMAAARILGRTGFGGFGLVRTVAMWCSTILALGAPTGLMIAAGRSRDKDKHHLVGIVFFYLVVVVVGAILWIVMDPPGPGSLTMPHLTAGVGALVVLHTAMQTLFTLWSRLLCGLDRFQMANLLSVANSFFMALGVIIGAILEGSYIGALWGGGVGLFFVAFVVAVIAITSWGIEWPSLRLIWRLECTVGMRSYIARVSEVIAETFGILYLSSTSDLAAVAAVVASRRLSTFLSQPAAVLNAVIMGKVSGQEGGKEDVAKTLQVARLTLVCALLCGLPLLACVRAFVLLTLGSEFSDAVDVMAFYLLSAIVRAHASVTAGLLVGQGCQWPFVVLKVVVLLLTVVGVVMAVPSLGPAGVAFVQYVMSLVMALAIIAILALQTRSLRPVFFRDDVALLRRLFRSQ